MCYAVRDIYAKLLPVALARVFRGCVTPQKVLSKVAHECRRKLRYGLFRCRHISFLLRLQTEREPKDSLSKAEKGCNVLLRRFDVFALRLIDFSINQYNIPVYVYGVFDTTCAKDTEISFSI